MRFVVLFYFVANIVSAQLSDKHARFHQTYVDSSGILIDSLPTPDDSVFIGGKEYEFAGINKKGKEKGLTVFDNLTLNLSLAVGDEEDRQITGFKKGFFWVVNNLTKIITLTFWNPELGSNRFFFNNETFRNDLKQIKNLYDDRGYFDAEIVKYKAKFSDDRKNVEIKIYINEGDPTVLAEDPQIQMVSSVPIVDIKGELDSKKIISQTYVKKGDPIDRGLIETSKALIQKIFSQNGYANTEVSESIDTVGRKKAKIVYQIIPGRYGVFGKTSVAGNYYKDNLPKNQVPDTTKKIVEDFVITRKVRYKEGRPFNPDKLNLSTGQINGLGVFRSVKPILTRKRFDVDSTLILPKNFLDSVRYHSDNRIRNKSVDVRRYGVPVDTLNIAIHVSDRKEKTLKPGIGFTNDYQDLLKNERNITSILNLQATWQSKNFMSGARKLQLSGQLSKGFRADKFFANHMEAKVSFRQPSFKIPLWNDADNDLLITVSGERNNTLAYDALKYETTPTFFRQINSQISMSFTPLSFTRVDIRRAAEISLENNVFTTNSKAGITFNSSNDFFYPTTGFLIFLNSDFAGFILPSDLKYLKLNFDNRKYFGLSKRLALAMRAHAGTLIPYNIKNGKSIPVTEQYFGGGPNSVRSWGIKELSIVSEDSKGLLKYSGGNSVIESGVELRYTLYLARDPNDAISGMDLAVFGDAGRVWEKYNFRNESYAGKKLPEKLSYAVGAGTRIRTLIGPIRIDVGYKLQDIKGIKVLNNGEVKHISSKASKNISPIALQITLGQPF